MRYKKAVTYFLTFSAIACMFTASYYFSYKQALRDFNENAVERNIDLIKELEKQGYLANTVKQGNDTKDNQDDLSDRSDETDDAAAVSSITDTILPSTEYTLQTYDLQTGQLKEEALPTPSYLIGLTRDEVITYLTDYQADLSLNEFEKGLVSFELISFSKDSIILRKTYNSDSVEYKYYLKAVNGYIVAFYGDQKTVYDYTGVAVENLPLEDRLHLEKGIVIKDLDELYAVLENYSS